MASAAVRSIIDKLVTLAHDLVLKHLCYIVNAGDNVEAITDDMEKLRRRRTDINSEVLRGERNGRMALAVVEGWCKKVEDYGGEIEEIERSYAQRGCILCGNFSFNCCSNYLTGKKAAERRIKLKELLEQGNFAAGITQECLPPAVQVIATSSRAKGQESYFKKAIQFLKEDNNFILGIWGAGGVGKSTLLAEINNSLAKDALGFDHVIQVVASRSCTPEKIQNQIIDQLKLGSTTLTNYLIKKNFLLILDDVWEPLKLADVGIPYPEREDNQSNMRRKVIIVSRNKAVCTKMQAWKPLLVECLNQEDAWDLFIENVGNIATAFCEEAEEIVKECKGLPLALVTIGRAMSSLKTVREWPAALRTLKSSKHISGQQKGISNFCEV